MVVSLLQKKEEAFSFLFLICLLRDFASSVGGECTALHVLNLVSWRWIATSHACHTCGIDASCWSQPQWTTSTLLGVVLVSTQWITSSTLLHQLAGQLVSHFCSTPCCLLLAATGRGLGHVVDECAEFVESCSHVQMRLLCCLS